MSQQVSEPYEYNTTLKVIFFKTYYEDTLQCPYKNYSSLRFGEVYSIMNLLQCGEQSFLKKVLQYLAFG
jgi:hypothetical protein